MVVAHLDDTSVQDLIRHSNCPWVSSLSTSTRRGFAEVGGLRPFDVVARPGDLQVPRRRLFVPHPVVPHQRRGDVLF